MIHLLLFLQKNKKIRFLVITLVLIILFTIIYWMLGSSDNFNFNFNPNNPNNQNNLTFLDALYFTLVTQSTIGYGDITAKSQLMRGIASIQITLIIIQIIFANL